MVDCHCSRKVPSWKNRTTLVFQLCAKVTVSLETCYQLGGAAFLYSQNSDFLQATASTNA